LPGSREQSSLTRGTATTFSWGNMVNQGRDLDAEVPSGERVKSARPAGREARRPWTLFGLFAAIYLITLRGHFGSQDEEALYMTSVMLVKQTEAALKVSWTLPEPGDARGPVRAGYELGQPALAIPLYLAGDRLGLLFPAQDRTYVVRFVVTLFGVLVTAATVATLYRFGRALGYGPGASTLTAVAYGLGTMAWPYSRTFFREPLVALALLCSFLALARCREQPGLRPALAGVAWLVLGVATKITTIVALPVLALYVLSSPTLRRQVRDWRHRGPAGNPRRPGFALSRRLALVGAGIAIAGTALIVAITLAGLAGRLPYDLQASFSPALVGLQGEGDLSFVGRALYGLTLSPGKGLIVFAPPVLAGLAGLALLARRRPAEAVVCAVLPAAFVLIYSFDASWHGGACWGPRYLLPALPLAVLPVGALANALWRIRARAAGQIGLGLLGLLLFSGGIVQVAGLSIDPVRYYLEVLSHRPLTLDGGPYYLQEVYFDPTLSPITGQLSLAARYSADLIHGPGRLQPVPYDPVDYRQYFQYLPSLDFALVHFYGWRH
jgi:hypothetical protein